MHRRVVEALGVFAIRAKGVKQRDYEVAGLCAELCEAPLHFRGRECLVGQKNTATNNATIRGTTFSVGAFSPARGAGLAGAVMRAV